MNIFDRKVTDNKLAWRPEDLNLYGQFDGTRFILNRHPGTVLTINHLSRDYRRSQAFDFAKFKAKVIDPFKLHCLQEDSKWCDHEASFVVNASVDKEENLLYSASIESFDERADKVRKALEECEPDKVEETRVYLVTSGKHGYSLHDHEAKDVSVPLENYNMTISYEKIKEVLETEGPGFLLFSGSPGTGKSFLIRKLMQEVKSQKFVIVPSDLASRDLANPAFLTFLLENFEGGDATLIVEDGETALASREKFGNPAVTSILNMSDGLLGDVFGFKILATINVEDNVDEALLRDGRCKAHTEFKKLTTEQIGTICKREGVAPPTKLDSMALASIYHHVKKQKEATK